MTTSAPNRQLPSWLLPISKVFACLTVLTIVVLFGTAGVLVQEHQAESLHGLGALALHALTGALTVTLAVMAWRGGHSWWPAALSLAVFGFSFVQASLGKGYTLYLHIPGALAITFGALWVAAWLFFRSKPA